MKIGVCSSIYDIKKVEDFGYDFLEGFISEITGLSDEEFRLLVEKTKKNKIKCLAFNMLFPKSIMVVGEEVDMDLISEYASLLFKRVSMLEGEIVVFGSGNSRKFSDSWGLKKAWEQLISVSRLLGEKASKYGITVVIEPLNKDNTNLLNTVTEGIELVQQINHPNVKLLADFYHMRLENEKMDVTTVASGEEGLDMLEEKLYDLIILDVLMGNMDGYEVVNTIRNRNITTPVLFLSGKDEEHSRLLGLTMGGDGYMTKPFSVAMLLAEAKAPSSVSTTD